MPISFAAQPATTPTFTRAPTMAAPAPAGLADGGTHWARGWRRAQGASIRMASLLLVAGTSLAGIQPAQATPPYRMPVVELEAGGQRIDAELARTEPERERGLMHRTVMPENHGMLFVFEQPAQYCFWMRNTLIPLTVAFLDEDGKVADLADMQPRDERSHCPSRPVRHALEMNQGWFDAHGVKVGDVVKGLETVPNGEPKP